MHHDCECFYDHEADIQLITKFCKDNYPDPEKWWSETHTKIRVWQQWAVDLLLHNILEAPPTKSTIEIVYNTYEYLQFHLVICDRTTDLHSMYSYAQKVMHDISEQLDPDDTYYYCLLKQRMEEEKDYGT